MTPTTTPLFELSDGGYRPTPFARGPWDPHQLHGGAVGALLAEIFEADLDPTFRTVRLTVDLVRPVPLAHLDVAIEVVRTGRRLVAKRAVVASANKTVAAASSLALRETPLPEDHETMATPPDLPRDGVDRWANGDAEAFLGGAMTFRFVPAPGDDADEAAWVHLHRNVLPGRAPSPLARAAAAADITSVVTRFEGTRRSGVGFLNADYSLHLHRHPSDEWLRIASLSRWEPNGIGTVTARLGDALGSVGQVTQALLLTPT